MANFQESLLKKLPQFYKSFFVLHFIFDVIVLIKKKTLFVGSIPNSLLCLAVLIVGTFLSTMVDKKSI